MKILAPLLLLAAPLAAQDPVAAARAHYAAHGPEILAEFRNLLALPCVAGDDAGIAANVAWIQVAFARRGVELEAVALPDASPVLVGELRAPGATDATPTLGVYVHYDGQPVDPDSWRFGPWTPTLVTGALEDGGKARAFPEAGEALDPEWRVYARSAGDDKAPIVAWLAALDALAAAGIPPSVNLVFLFEGEEEAGSVNLARYLGRLRERLAPIEAWLFCDGPVHQSRRPQLCFGVRGVAGLEVTVYGASRPLHSGHYGNFAPNAGERLVALLAAMKHPDGRVAIPGFYDTTEPPTEAERAALDALPDFDAALREDLGLAPADEGAESYFECLLRPSLNFRGLSAGNVGAKARNVVPNEATASIDMRLVRGNDPLDMQRRVEAFIAAQGYHLVRRAPDAETRRVHARIARITPGGGYPAARTPMDEPAVQPVIAAARAAAGEDLLLVPTLGGSLPLYLFEQPVVIVPIANHDNNQHAANENLRLANLAYGVELFAAILGG